LIFPFPESKGASIKIQSNDNDEYHEIESKDIVSPNFLFLGLKQHRIISYQSFTISCFSQFNKVISEKINWCFLESIPNRKRYWSFPKSTSHRKT